MYHYQISQIFWGILEFCIFNVCPPDASIVYSFWRSHLKCIIIRYFNFLCRFRIFDSVQMSFPDSSKVHTVYCTVTKTLFCYRKYWTCPQTCIILTWVHKIIPHRNYSIWSSTAGELLQTFSDNPMQEQVSNPVQHAMPRNCGAKRSHVEGSPHLFTVQRLKIMKNIRNST